jgi:hypothetical protein
MYGDLMTDAFLLIAGAGGILISILHGAIGYQRILSRIEGLPEYVRRVNSTVFQLSTFYWFSGGVSLLLTPSMFAGPQREIVALACAGMYAIGAVGNFWATRGRHFGWLMLAVVSILAVFGANGG